MVLAEIIALWDIYQSKHDLQRFLVLCGTSKRRVIVLKNCSTWGDPKTAFFALGDPKITMRNTIFLYS
jgi:hypothetical protein